MSRQFDYNPSSWHEQVLYDCLLNEKAQVYKEAISICISVMYAQ